MSAPSRQAAEKPGSAPAQSKRETVLLHMPVDVRSTSLAIIAFVVCLGAMQWARDVLVPILLGLVLSYALTPVVNQIERWRVPRAVGAALVLGLIVAGFTWGAWSLSGEANALLDTVPQVTQKLRELIQGKQGSDSAIAKVQAAAAEIESVGDPMAPAASGPAGATSAAGQGASGPASAASPSPRRSVSASRQPAAARASTLGPTRVVVDRQGLDLRSYVLTGTLGVLALLGQIAIVLFVALFLLASGSNFRRKMVRLAGPRLSQKRVTIDTLNEITGQIQRYLLVQLGVSALVGLATWLAFFLLGVNQSAVWGVVAGVTNLIPYLGAILVGGASTVVALVQFGTVGMALTVGATSFAIHTLIGNVLTPWWMGRASRMSPFAVFVAVLLFGWLWGVVGLLLGPPILMVVKSICDRVDELAPVGELLGA
jgi:predicted PurR-regulated permease PerM